MTTKSLYIIIALFFIFTITSCASLDHVMYFKPSAETGEVSESKFMHIGWYPSLPNLISFPDIGIDIYCPNESYNVIYSGPILSTEPLRVLPLVPGLLGFIISPLDFNPDDVIIELHFDDKIRSIQIDPKSIKLFTSDGSVHNPIRIMYGLGYRYYDNKDFISDNTDLPVDTLIVIENKTNIRNIAFFFDLRAWETGSFIFSANNLLVNNAPAVLPQIAFEKKHGLRHFIMVD